MSAIVVGHKNPDTDSIAAATAMADFLNKRGTAAKAYRQGNVTPESAFVLEKAGIAAPELLPDVSGQKVVLVDHSDLGQAPANLDKAELLGIVDHHKLGDVTTPTPLFMWVWPVGCSCTVIKNMYDFYGIAVPRNIAILLLGAILSDTLIFKSPTTTDEDKKAVKELAEISGIEDYQAFGMEMFKVKSAVQGVPAKELLFRDYKDFEMNGKKVGVGQLEVVDLSLFDNMREDLKKAMAEARAEGRHSVLLLLTDIMREGSELLYLSDEPDLVKKIFGISGDDTWMPGVLSRKKDVIPRLESAMRQ